MFRHAPVITGHDDPLYRFVELFRLLKRWECSLPYESANVQRLPGLMESSYPTTLGTADVLIANSRRRLGRRDTEEA